MEGPIEHGHEAGLDRLVHAIGEPPPLDQDGFLRAGALRDPAASGLHRLTDLATAPHGFVLLGAGGLGKTTSLETLESCRPVPGGVVNAMVIDRPELASLLGGRPDSELIYLDALDQAAIIDASFLTRLREIILRNPGCASRLRLACRPAVWRSSLAAALHDLDPGFSEYTLAPLDRQSAAAVVGRVLGDADRGVAFVGALAEAGQGALAATVGQMLDVARAWKRTGTIESVGGAMASEVNRLLGETNPDMPTNLAVPRRLVVARRLAAFAAFGGRRVLAVTNVDGANDDLDLAALPDIPEPDAHAGTIGPADYREVAGTGLFDPVAPGAVSFRHQRYLDHLAGIYLAHRATGPRQVRPLVCDEATGTITPSMVGVVGWVASVEPALVADLVCGNAAALAAAASDVDLPASVRADVVNGLLGNADSAAAEPDWSVQTAALRYDGLAEQLVRAAAGAGVTPEAWWWIARLAAVAPDPALVPILQGIAADSTLFAYPRRAAIAALGTIGDEDDRRPIRDLLTEPNDDDNEILAACIDVLYPDLLSTDELLAALRPQMIGMVGGYGQTLRELPDRIPDTDLSTVLLHLADPGRHDSDRTLEPLVAGLIARVWARRDEPAMLTVLADALHLLATDTEGLLLRSSDFPWTSENEADRRLLVRALADSSSHGGEMTWFAVHQLRLLEDGDAIWLLDELATMPPDRAAALAPAIRLVLGFLDATLVDRILRLPSDHPAYSGTEWLRQPIPLNDEGMAYERKWRAQEIEHLRETERRDIELLEQIRCAVAEMGADPLRWVDAVDCLHQLSGSGEEGFGFDLVERTGWARLAPTEQRMLLDNAIAFVRAHRPEPATWLGRARHQTMPTRDWFGIHALTTSVRHHPDRLSALDRSDWEAWAAPIVLAPAVVQDDSRVLRRDLVRLAPAEIRPILVAAARDHLLALAHSGDEDGLDSRHVLEDLAGEIAHDVVRLLRDGRVVGRLAADLLRLVADHASDAVDRDLIETLTRSTDEAVRSAALALRGTIDPDPVLQEIVSGAVTGDALTTAVERLAVADLTDEVLRASTGDMLDRWPYSTEPLINSPEWRAEWASRDLREVLLQQLADRGDVDALHVLAERPGVDGRLVARHARSAAARAAEHAVSPVSPTELLDMLARGDARLVRHGTDLIEALVAFLEHLQRELGIGAHRDIWDSGRPMPEDSISDWLQRQMQQHLRGRVVPDRELQVRRRRDAGIGDRVDLTVTVGSTGESIRVLIEAKTIGNVEVDTGLTAQLVDRYLRPLGLRHGIFLVYWVRPDQRPSSWNKDRGADPEALLDQLREQAASVRADGFHIVPFVLDISPAPS